MAQYNLTITTQATSYEPLERGWYLVLINVVQSPIHLGLIFKGMLYEYTVKQGFKRTKYAAWSKQYTKLKLPLIALALDELGYSWEDIETQLDDAFNTFNKAPLSCIIPINNVLQELYNINTTNCNTVFSLLDKLKFSDIIIQTLLLNSTIPAQNDGAFGVEVYDFEVVQNYISALKN
ncbi:MAG: hypothetical protein H7331_06245 [Bacteroidia bacterium]|nr:hypothetical protein [Bacteroidia bacterium]